MSGASINVLKALISYHRRSNYASLKNNYLCDVSQESAENRNSDSINYDATIER